MTMICIRLMIFELSMIIHGGMSRVILTYTH